VRRSNIRIILLIIIIALLPNNIEELQAVLALTRADDTQPIAQLLLLEELLRQILQVSPAELLVRHDFDAAVADVGDGDGVAEVPRPAVDFDALLEEGCEGGGVEDAVLSWLGCVDCELLMGCVR
jgi:ribosomal RNA-processing protein 12